MGLMLISIWYLPPARRLPPQMFREYPNDVTFNGGGFVKQVGRNSFNGVSQRQKLRLPRGAFRSLQACQSRAGSFCIVSPSLNARGRSIASGETEVVSPAKH